MTTVSAALRRSRERDGLISSLSPGGPNPDGGDDQVRVAAAFGYICVEDADEDAISGHRDRLAEVANSHELDLIEIYVDRNVVTNPERQGFSTMLDEMRKHLASVLLVPALRHLSSDPAVRNMMRTRIHAIGGSLLSLEVVRPTHGVDRGNHPLGQLRAQRGWSYQMVARMIARRARNDGVGMAAERQKIWRWEHKGVTPDRISQGYLADVVGVDRKMLDVHPWPAWLPTVDDLDWVKEVLRLTNELADARGRLAAQKPT